VRVDVVLAAIAVLSAALPVSADPAAAPHPAVVRVAVPNREGASYGSGSLVAVDDTSGLILTNWHVVRDAAGPIVVYFPDGFSSRAYLLRSDSDWDLAALAVRRPNVQPIAIANQPARPGDLLWIVGYGSGSYRVASGRCVQYVSPGGNQPFEMVELSASARDGDSGGPILNARGELAGVLFGSAAGRTTGSYCGRLRWFVGLAEGDFRRLSAQVRRIDQLNRPPAPRPPTALAAVAGEPPANPVSASPAAFASAWRSPAIAARATGVRASRSTLPRAAAAPPAKDATVAASSAVAAPAPCSLSGNTVPLPPAPTLPLMDQAKTLFALIGLLAVLYHALRLLGAAVG
jgi:hypothetical protein